MLNLVYQGVLRRVTQGVVQGDGVCPRVVGTVCPLRQVRKPQGRLPQLGVVLIKLVMAQEVGQPQRLLFLRPARAVPLVEQLAQLRLFLLGDGPVDELSLQFPEAGILRPVAPVQVSPAAVLHAAVIDLEPPFAVRPGIPPGLPEDGLHGHALALHLLGPVQGVQVRPPGVLPAEAVAAFRRGAGGPVCCRGVLAATAHAPLCHGLLHGLVEPLRVDGEGVDPGVGVRENFLQNGPCLRLCAVLAGVFRNGDHAPQLPDILLHHTAQLFRPILFPDAVLQLPDQARRLCRPVMENLMVRDLVRRHPDVVRLHDDPVPGEYTPDQPGAVRRPDLDAAGHEHGIQPRLFPHPVRCSPQAVIPGALRNDLKRFGVRAPRQSQVLAAYRFSP